MDDDSRIRTILQNSRTIAVVGASPHPWRDSGEIALFLSEHGYTVYPVNPKYTDLLGLVCYPTLKNIPGPVDIVDVFRKSEALPEIAEEAIAIKAKVLWGQLGVVDEEARKRAEKAGLEVVMDHCIAVEYRRLMR